VLSEHEQTLLVHLWFAPQHALPHFTALESQQRPDMHCWLPQEWLQAPQWALLVCRSTHEPPHQVSPAPQQVLFEQLPLAH
jgi:hypothetical protein